MKRPEKKLKEDYHPLNPENEYDYGRNDAIDEYEAFLPSFDEILHIVQTAPLIAKAINKRLRGEK